MKNQAKVSLGTHTPGPWYASGVHVQTTAEHDNYVCEAEGDNEAQAEANARLIASAPELLAALHDVREWANRVLESDIKSEFLREFLAAMNDAEKVIARAEGTA